MLRIGEVHGVEVDTDRDLRLAPGTPLIVGQDDQAIFTDSDQAFAGIGDIPQGFLCGLVHHFGRLVEGIDEALGWNRGGRQRQRHCQHCPRGQFQSGWVDGKSGKGSPYCTHVVLREIKSAVVLVQLAAG
ncbi:hypothetical protein D9M68_398100 [compost metagenome]